VLAPAIAASGAGGAGRDEDAGAAQARGFAVALALALPAALALALLAQPIAATLFERGAFGPHDSAAVAAALAAIAAGLPGHALEKVLGAISFAHADTRTPMLTALAALAAMVAGALALFPHHGAPGVAVAIAGSGWAGAALLGAVLWRRGWLAFAPGGARRLAGIAAATLAMGLVLAAGCALAGAPFAPGGSQIARFAALAGLVVIGLAAYLAALAAFGVARLHDLLGTRR
jgi:putative peptidoglycan lipid II flippase